MPEPFVVSLWVTHVSRKVIGVIVLLFIVTLPVPTLLSMRNVPSFLHPLHLCLIRFQNPIYLNPPSSLSFMRLLLRLPLRSQTPWFQLLQLRAYRQILHHYSSHMLGDVSIRRQRLLIQNLPLHLLLPQFHHLTLNPSLHYQKPLLMILQVHHILIYLLPSEKNLDTPPVIPSRTMSLTLTSLQNLMPSPLPLIPIRSPKM
ncbi:hypothetical protein Hanom_Chr16g01458731 [Helianthus anomalus]